MRFMILLLICTGIMFPQQQGTLIKPEKKVIIPTYEDDFFSVDNFALRTTMKKVLAKRKEKTVMVYTEERLQLFFSDYEHETRKHGCDMPKLMFENVGEMDVQKIINELIKEFAMQKQYQIICLDQLNIKSSSNVFAAIPRQLNSSDITKSVVISSRSYKKFGLPSFDVFYLAIFVNLQIHIANDLNATITIDPQLTTWLQPAQGTTYATNYSLVNFSQPNPDLVDACVYPQSWMFASPHAQFYNTILATAEHFSIGSTGKMETQFIKDFGAFLKHKNIKTNCDAVATSMSGH